MTDRPDGGNVAGDRDVPRATDQPVVSQTRPYVMEMEPGTYFWCRCGRSKKQPFCDGSHKGTAFTPIKVSLEERKQIAWCGCKHTQAGHLCDGSHEKFR